MHPARPSIVAPLLAWLAVSAVCDAAPPTAAAEPVVMKTIDDARLYDLLVAELAAVLDGRQRLAPLPRNVSDVAIGPRGEPCFIVPGTPDTRPEALETAVARAGRQEPGFRVLWEARLLGHDGDDALAIAISPEPRVAVIEGKTSRNISLPPRNPPSHAIRVGGRWIFLTPGGIAGENETTFWPDSGRLHVGVVKRLLRMGDDGMAAVQNDPNRSPSLWYGIRTAGTWTTGSLAGAPEPLRSAVRLADGRWLAIGQHIVESRADRPPRPTEAQLEATLAAARAADWTALAPLLEAVSTYPRSDTAGLANLLQKIPPRNQALRSVTTVLENARRELARIPATEGLDQQQTDQVREILAACEKQLGATAKNLASAVPDVLLRSPADISARLQSGMQFYRGRWFSVLDVVRQETLDSALLWVKLGNTPDEPSGTLALARLEADGGLRIVQEVKEALPYGQASMVAAPAADVAYFVTPGRGIARVSATGVDWISTRARSPVQLIGADARGRVYFRKTDPRPGGAPAIDDTSQLWVLTPDGVEEQTPVANWPTFGQPVAAADGSIWFLQPQRQRSAGPMQPDAAPAATPGIEVKQIDVTIEPAQDPAVAKGPGFQGRPDGFEGPRLCRLTGPRSLTEYVLPGPALTATALHAGRDAAWFSAASRVINMPQNPLAFLAGNVLRTDKDLHGLAERSFDALLAAAPDALPLESWREIVPNVDADAVTPQQLLRTGDLLWVNAAGRVEIYARGRPLAVNDRLVLRGLQLHGARVRPLLVGPLRVNGRTSVLLRATATAGSGYTWITPNDNGVQIDPVATLPADQRGYFPSWLGNVPLVATDRSAAFFNCSEGRVWKILGPQTFHLAADAGTPFLGLREADAFLATRSQFTKRGVRLCKPGARIDVPVLASRRLDPVAVAANGRILCLQPDGLSWLAPHPEQGYVVAATRRLPDGLAVNGYVGRLDNAEVVTAYDGSQQRVVVVPDAPAEAAAP